MLKWTNEERNRLVLLQNYTSNALCWIQHLKQVITDVIKISNIKIPKAFCHFQPSTSAPGIKITNNSDQQLKYRSDKQSFTSGNQRKCKLFHFYIICFWTAGSGKYLVHPEAFRDSFVYVFLFYKVSVFITTLNILYAMVCAFPHRMFILLKWVLFTLNTKRRRIVKCTWKYLVI